MLKYNKIFDDHATLTSTIYHIIFAIEGGLKRVGLDIQLDFEPYPLGGPNCLVIFIRPADLLRCNTPRNITPLLESLAEDDYKIAVLKVFNEPSTIRRGVPGKAAQEVSRYVNGILSVGSKTNALMCIADKLRYVRKAEIR